MDLERSLGFGSHHDTADIDHVIQYINLKLASLGCPIYGNKKDSQFLKIAQPLLNSQQEKNKLLSNYLCPADRRIQNFLDRYLEDVPVEDRPKLPTNTFILDRHGLARTISLPPHRDSFVSDIIRSYRVKQGILHNPKHDRRTTQGVFHIAEEGFPIADDKLAVPKAVFSKLLVAALNPPQEFLRLPFTSGQKNQAELFVSLLLRPVVCPEVPGFISEKTMEIRFFAPGNLVSNLDFVESIFGNAGDPHLPEHDAALDPEHWTGHTGCVILAPHLIYLKKKDLGLPHYDQATERQRRDGMCWQSPEELYNGGTSFKATCRDERGIIVTVIADNYFGYCKKEVKTQISFSSNLFGVSEEEHSGGAIAFPSYDLGEKFHLEDALARSRATFQDVLEIRGDQINLQPEGYGIDRHYSTIIYVPQDARFDLRNQSIRWLINGREQKIKLLAFHTYVLPSGYKIHLEKQLGGPTWRLIGTVAEGTLCHKPSTVSGGGKSEISKSIADAMIQGPIFTADFQKDFDRAAEIINRNFGDRFARKYPEKRSSRPILSPDRSLGSVIKLFTPSSEFTEEYNLWLASIPHHIKEIVFVVKRHYQPEWGENWREHFSADMINGYLGHELKYENQKLVANYLRVGHEKDGSRRIYKLRQDFNSADKLQVEDDITASVVVPKKVLNHLNTEYDNPSVKLVQNCEYRLFQRPDDAIFRGYDKQTESDLAQPGNFLSNFQPLSQDDAKRIVEDAIGFDLYTDPMKQLIREFAKTGKPGFFVSSAHPRVVNGKPSKNPRYLQNRPDIMNPRQKYLAQVGAQLFRRIPSNESVLFPVNAVLSGRRNNPPDKKNGIRPLAVFNPIHYQDLPELFMDFICSVTGKSPSTTGFGSEGALTKGPFNALWFTADLNNALVSFILTGYHGFTSAAGYIGPNIRVDHDISLLIPEIWCRMSVKEREPEFLIQNGYLEKLHDFEVKGKKVLASRLGYRITIRFVHAFLGRIFNNPNAVFSEEMLKPERQDMGMFVDGIDNIVVTQKRVAENYFRDGSAEAACRPIQALLHIMIDGNYQGKDINHPEIRHMFTREYLLKSDWYQERLLTKQKRDIALAEKHVQNLENFMKSSIAPEALDQLHLIERLEQTKHSLEYVRSSQYLESLHGTIGADPLFVTSPSLTTNQSTTRSAL